jgi:uncharacterized protein YkwD
MPVPALRASVVVALAAVVCLFAAARAPAASEVSVKAVQARDALERALFGEINEARRARGLDALERSRALERAAGAHARAMGAGGFFSHSSLGGDSPQERIHDAGGSSPVGETILWNSQDLTAEEALDLWLGSSSHRSILLSRAYATIGIGAVHAVGAPGVFGGRDAFIVVADFAS